MAAAPDMRSGEPAGALAVTPDGGSGAILVALDAETAALARVAARLASGTEDEVEQVLRGALGGTPAERVRPGWVEEVLLQTYLFAGFPRALNGMHTWRRLSGRPAPGVDDGARPRGGWAEDGARTCAAVYGAHYGRLREHVRALHPALDDWMLEEGYGKVLSRPGLDLPRRELCIVAACAVTGQRRQLRAHLRGARNAGVAAAVVSAVLETVVPLAPPEAAPGVWEAWRQVQGG